EPLSHRSRPLRSTGGRRRASLPLCRLPLRRLLLRRLPLRRLPPHPRHHRPEGTITAVATASTSAIRSSARAVTISSRRCDSVPHSRRRRFCSPISKPTPPSTPRSCSPHAAIPQTCPPPTPGL